MNNASAAYSKSPLLSPTLFAHSFDWGKMTEEILGSCLHEFGAESASIFLMEDNGQSLQLVKAIGSRKNHHCGRSLRVGEGISGCVVSTRKPILVNDFSSNGMLVPRGEGHAVDTLMSCPVLNESSALAVINVAGRGAGRPFSQDDLKKLQNMAAECASVLSRVVVLWRSSLASQPAVPEGKASGKNIGKTCGQPQEAENYNDSILRCLSGHVLIFDLQFKAIYCSREEELAMFLWGNKGAEVRNSSLLDLPFGIERRELKRKLEGLISGRAPFSLSNVQVRNCPEFRLLNMSFSPYFSADGDLLGGLLLLDDNTKNYEMQRRLVEAERFSIIGSLTSMITHEVNNPLDGVMRLINLSLGKLEEEDGPVREYLGEAQKGLNRIASLISSLLSFSRKSASLDAGFTPLNTVIDNAAATIRSVKQSIDLKLAPENPTVKTNDFDQIINNLLSNSCDAVSNGVPSGRGNILVETKLENGYLHIIVGDNGCGIPKRIQSQIFKVFCTTKEYGKGTGLGLAIVKKMMDKYEGTIKVESEENVGTRMRLTFPLSNLAPEGMEPSRANER